MTENSNMKAIKNFFETCSLLKNGKINVDYLKDDINSYSIDQTPSNPIVKKYTDGGCRKQVTFDFSVQAPLSSSAIINLANSKFCEDFTKWVEEQDKKGNLPDIPGIVQVKCTSSGYLLQKTETTAIYIIQMNCQYDEEF
nr:MAG TPA: Minor capsid protein from bacteriophage [Caudoviricetes sp.]